MLGLAVNRASPIGMDIGGRHVKLAQAVRTGRGWSLVSCMSLPRVSPGQPMDAREAGQLGLVLTRRGFRGRRIVLAVPEDVLVTGMLEAPPRTSGAPVEEIARAELASMHDFDPAAAETLCWDLPGTGRPRAATQVMAIACRHADAESLLDPLESADIEPVALESRMHACVRACRTLLPQTGLAAIMDVEWDWTVLVMVFNGLPIYRRLVAEAAVHRLAETIGETLELDSEGVDYLLTEVGLRPAAPDAGGEPMDVAHMAIRKHLDVLVDSVQSPFTYAARQHGVPHVSTMLMTGFGAAIPGVSEELGRRLQLPVRVVRPVDVMTPARDLDGTATDPALTVAVGLACFGN